MTTLRKLGFFAAAYSLLFAVPGWAQNAAPAAKQGAAKIAAKYVVRKTTPLSPALQQNKGKIELFTEAKLELLTDTRIKPDMSDADTFDFLKAKIRLINPNGSTAQEKTLERSRATLDTAPPLYGKTGPPTYLLTVDYSADMGSYNGPITFLVEVVKGAMHFVSVGGKPLSLMRSLKTDWKFAPAKSSMSQSTDILEVACRPNAHLYDVDTDKNFTTYYRRYHWNGHQWIKRERSRLGFWEDDGDFPKVALFPPAQP